MDINLTSLVIYVQQNLIGVSSTCLIFGAIILIANIFSIDERICNDLPFIHWLVVFLFAVCLLFVGVLFCIFENVQIQNNAIIFGTETLIPIVVMVMLIVAIFILVSMIFHEIID